MCVASNGLRPGARPLGPWGTETWGGPGIGLFMASEQGRGWAPGVLALAPRPSVGALGLWAEQGQAGGLSSPSTRSPGR